MDLRLKIASPEDVLPRPFTRSLYFAEGDNNSLILEQLQVTDRGPLNQPVSTPIQLNQRHQKSSR